ASVLTLKVGPATTPCFSVELFLCHEADAPETRSTWNCGEHVARNRIQRLRLCDVTFIRGQNQPYVHVRDAVTPSNLIQVCSRVEIVHAPDDDVRALQSLHGRRLGNTDIHRRELHAAISGPSSPFRSGCLSYLEQSIKPPEVRRRNEIAMICGLAVDADDPT